MIVSKSEARFQLNYLQEIVDERNSTDVKCLCVQLCDLFLTNSIESKVNEFFTRESPEFNWLKELEEKLCIYTISNISKYPDALTPIYEAIQGGKFGSDFQSCMEKAENRLTHPEFKVPHILVGQLAQQTYGVLSSDDLEHQKLQQALKSANLFEFFRTNQPAFWPKDITPEQASAKLLQYREKLEQFKNGSSNAIGSRWIQHNETICDLLQEALAPYQG